MTKATIKLYASLSDYLPAGAVKNAIDVKLPPETTILQSLDDLHVPRERCHLVLLNGEFVPPGLRASQVVKEGDTIAVWPPVAGG